MKPLKRQKTTRRFGKYVLLALLFGGIGYGAVWFFDDATPLGPDYSAAIPELGRMHIPAGSTRPEYNSNPPTSGPHYAETARTGFRTEAIPDGHLIHNLEHGDIWISYNPRLAPDVVDQLKQFGGSKVVITPRAENEKDIALAAWGRLDTFNVEGGVLDEQRIRDFIGRYVNRGPERILGPSAGHSGI